MKWITFFSQTGSEILELTKVVNRVPDLIVFNGDTIPQPILQLNTLVIQTPHRPTEEQYRDILSMNNSIATFHGWLKIVPPSICRQFEGRLLNGHPGLITLYPELKGFNPQEKAYKLKHGVGGSVVHRLTEEVDNGEILSFSSCSLDNQTLDQVYSSLRKTSIEAWEKILKGILC